MPAALCKYYFGWSSKNIGLRQYNISSFVRVTLHFLFKHPSSKNRSDVRPLHSEYFINIWILYHRFESFEIPSYSLLYNMCTTRVSCFCVFVIRLLCTILCVCVCLCLCLCYRKLIKNTIII